MGHPDPNTKQLESVGLLGTGRCENVLLLWQKIKGKRGVSYGIPYLSSLPSGKCHTCTHAIKQSLCCMYMCMYICERHLQRNQQMLRSRATHKEDTVQLT